MVPDGPVRAEGNAKMNAVKDRIAAMAVKLAPHTEELTRTIEGVMGLRVRNTGTRIRGRGGEVASARAILIALPAANCRQSANCVPQNIFSPAAASAREQCFGWFI